MTANSSPTRRFFKQNCDFFSRVDSPSPSPSVTANQEFSRQGRTEGGNSEIRPTTRILLQSNVPCSKLLTTPSSLDLSNGFERIRTSHEDKFHRIPVTNSFTSGSADLRSKFISNGIPPDSLMILLFSSFCRPYERFLKINERAISHSINGDDLWEPSLETLHRTRYERCTSKRRPRSYTQPGFRDSAA